MQIQKRPALHLSAEHEPAMALEQSACDIDEPTKAILLQAGAYHRVIAIMAESWLAQRPISVLTALAKSGEEKAVMAAAYEKRHRDLTPTDRITLTAIAEAAMDSDGNFIDATPSHLLNLKRAS